MKEEIPLAKFIGCMRKIHIEQEDFLLLYTNIYLSSILKTHLLAAHFLQSSNFSLCKFIKSVFKYVFQGI